MLALVLTALAVVDPTIAFERYQLKNGLTVILSEDHRVPQVAVNVWYRVGAANQLPGKSGFAHLFEHMMFSGAKHIGAQPFRVLESIGTTGGRMANGTTSWDRTNYFEVVPAAELPTALWLESDRMAFLLDAIDQKKLEVQRDVVANERRQSYENRPYGMSDLRVCDVFFPEPHPYFDCIIGSPADIQRASLDDLKTFFRRYYAPSNASISIVGDFDPARAKALVEAYFGPIPRAPDVVRPALPQPRLTGVIRQTVIDPAAKLPQLDLDWTGVKRLSPEEPSGEVLARILAEGKASRLYQELVFRRRVAAEVAASSFALSLGGFFRIKVTPLFGHGNDELEPLVDAILRDVREHGVTDDEVERTKRIVIADKLRALERLGGFGGRADVLNEYETFAGDPGFLAKDLARYRAVTPESVRDFAKTYLVGDRRLVLDVEPKSHAGTP